jgi:GH24 family phage-related lysozyme (muramidase)
VIAAKIGNSKYYHDPLTGAIVDEQGQPAPKRIAEQLVQDKVSTTAKVAPRRAQSIPEIAKLKKEIAKLRQLNSKLIKTNKQMISGTSVAFELLQNALALSSKRNSELVDAMNQQNFNFQEKVIELLTGIKAPARSSGETKTNAPTSRLKKGKAYKISRFKKPQSKYQRRVAGMTAAQKKAHSDRIQSRAEQIAAIRVAANVGTLAKSGIVGAAGGVLAGGTIAALLGVRKEPPKPDLDAMNARTLGPDGGNIPIQQGQTRAEQEAARTPPPAVVQQPPAGTPTQQAPSAPARPVPTEPPGAPQRAPSAATGAGGIEATARRLLAVHEGRRNRPYKDSKGLWTVGIGHLIGDGRSLPANMDRTFSEAEIDEIFSKDYAHHAAAAAKIPGYDKINDMGKVALIDLTFNMGTAWYKKWPNFTKAMSEGDWQRASQSLQQSAWYGQVGRRAPTIVGLVRNGGAGGGGLGAPTGGAVAGAGGAGGAAPSAAAPTGTPEKPTAVSAAAAANQAAGAAVGAPNAVGGGNVREAQSGIRRLPLSPELRNVLQSAARAAGVDVTVTSGGQPAFPRGPRTGSKRHDLGNAADLDLYIGKRILSDSNPADIAIKKKFVDAAAAGGASGIGAGYMGPTKIHVGFGTRALWGGASWLKGTNPGSPNVQYASAPTTAVQGARMANESAERAIAQGTAPTGGRMIVMNNTRTINNTQIIHQPGDSLPRGNRRNEGFNPLQVFAGALVGKAISRAF